MVTPDLLTNSMCNPNACVSIFVSTCYFAVVPHDIFNGLKLKIMGRGIDMTKKDKNEIGVHQLYANDPIHADKQFWERETNPVYWR